MAARRWSVPSYANLRWRQWNSEWIVHHGLANDTHRLAEIPGQFIVHLCEHGEQSSLFLASRFAVDPELAEEILDQLAGLNLVTRLE